MKQTIFTTILIFAFCFSAMAQESTNLKRDKFLSPSEETFQKSDNLIAPWRETGCYTINYEFNEPNCHLVTLAEFISSDMLTIYNADGSVWYRFSVNPASPQYFTKNKKPNFLPFSTEGDYTPISDRINYPSYNIFLRMIGESPNWYKVEISEETRETKYIAKSDKNWAKTTWSYWLFEGMNLQLDNHKIQLRDAPDGQIIEQSADMTFEQVKVLKVIGDWAYVESYTRPQKYRGWIRWRKDRDLLVGTVFTSMKFPEVKADDIK